MQLLYKDTISTRQSLCNDRRGWSRQRLDAQQMLFFDKSIEVPVLTLRQIPVVQT